MNTRSSCNSRAGLSLAEVMFVMTLVLVVTGLMAGLVREYSDMLRFGRGKTHTVEIAQAALSKMAGELAQAYRIVIPAPSATHSVHEIEFERLNPDPIVQRDRLPPFGQAAPTSWSPFSPGVRTTIRYQLSSTEKLLRSVDGEIQELADEITDLSISNQANDGLRLAISTRESRRIRTLSTHVYLPATVTPP